MDNQASLRWQYICAWFGPVILVSFVFFWGWVGHNLPPAGPGLNASQIAGHYALNSVGIRVGFVASVVVMTFYMPWSAVVSARMARIGKGVPVLSFLQLIGGALTVMVVSMSATFWIAAAFRPERNPEITQMLHDMGWLTIDQLYACTTFQMIAAAVIGLHDKSAQPLFPKWACWYAIWAGLTFLPASLTAFMKFGPFAWNGVLSYYFPYFAWLVWFTLFSCFLLRSISLESRSQASG